MKKLTLIALLATALCTYSQDSKAQFRLAGGIDLLSTPFFENVPKYRFGVEANYFIANSFALTGGLEFIEKDLGGQVGFRFYPISPVFLRLRGILNANSDVSIGMGYAIPINKGFRVETMADYFAVNSDFALRLGLSVSL